MKISDSRPKTPAPLRIDQTTPGCVYFYTVAGSYVLRTQRDRDRHPFVDLESGRLWAGEDGKLFEVDAELVLR